MNRKRVLKFALILAAIIATCFLALVATFFWAFANLYSTGISASDTEDATHFCEELFAEVEKQASFSFMSFDELPETFKAKAPDAIRTVSFGLWREGQGHWCCFASTESGNMDWGYRDCLLRVSGNSSFFPKRKTIGGYPDCTVSGRRLHSFEGQKVCVN